ncbi:MAG TPA: carbamate kinase [Methylocella sp.]|nr:carbamate kinase [Methylocella sp.]
MTAAAQRLNVQCAVSAIADVVSAGHRVVISHGNGPQIGLLALQTAGYGPDEGYPLDVLGAETEGAIGYMIEQELENLLPQRKVAALLTQVEVDPRDSAFQNPTKPIGPIYGLEEAQQLAAQRNWMIKRDGDKYRRVVASPRPQRIADIAVIRILLERDVIVICAGGGGIPVIRTPSGGLVGIEAVIDKDLASALLARELGADRLLLLTDVEAVFDGWGTPCQVPIRRASPMELQQRNFAEGSMGPKVEAACDFVRATGKAAGIGSLPNALAILQEKAGTWIATT